MAHAHIRDPRSAISQRDLGRQLPFQEGCRRGALESGTLLGKMIPIVSVFSEHILQSHLHDAPVRGAQDPAERWAVTDVVGTPDCRYDPLEWGRTVIRVVRYVEGF